MVSRLHAAVRLPFYPKRCSDFTPLCVCRFIRSVAALPADPAVALAVLAAGVPPAAVPVMAADR